MPILLEEPNPDTIQLRSPTGGPVPKPVKPDGDILSAAFRQENLVVNALSLFRSRPQPEPGYNPFDDIKGTDYEYEYADNFTYSQSRAETAEIKARIERERKDRDLLASNGAFGTAATFLAGLADPTLLIPGTAIYRTAKGGGELLKSAAVMGMSVGAQAAGAEAIKQAAQPTRRPEEAFLNIGTATLLGVLLGGGAAMMLGKAERQVMEAGFRQDRGNLMSTVSARSVGAAQADTRTLELSPFLPSWVSRPVDKAREQVARIPVVGGALNKIAGLPEMLATRTNPVMRIMTGPSVEARRILSDLAEIPLRVEENFRGIPTSRFGVPLEREIRNAVRQAEYQLTKSAEDAFRSFRFSGQQVKFAKFRAALDRRIGKSDAMTFDEFMAEVDTALRNGDLHNIAEVQTLARQFREIINAPFEKAKQLGVLDDGAPLGAVSYAPRRFEREKLIAGKPEFVTRYVDWRRQDQAVKAGLQEDIGRDWAATRSARIEGRKITGRLETLSARIDDLESRLSERGLEARAADTRLTKVEARAQEAAAAVVEAKAFLDELRTMADTPAVREQIAMLERDLRLLEGQAKPADLKDIEALGEELDKAEVREMRSLLTGDQRRLARIVIGKARPPKPPSFWKWLAGEGGVKDDGGDLAATLGGKRFDTKGKRLLNPDGLQWDRLQEKLMGEFPELRARWSREGQAEDFSDDIREAIAASVHGEEPGWFLDVKWNDADRVLAETSQAIEQSAAELGIKFTTVEDVSRFLRGEADDRLTEADYDAMISSIETSGAATDYRVAAIDTQDRLAIRQGTLKVIADNLRQAKAGLAKERIGAGKAGVREAEAGIAANRSMGRLGVLYQRARMAERQQDFLLAMQKQAADDEAAALQRVEQSLSKWEGRSSDGAKKAVAKRTEAEAERAAKQAAGNYKGKGERLTSADREVARAVRSVIKSDRNMTDAELASEADQTFNEIIGTPDGRLPKDDPGYGRLTASSPEGEGRGPLIARQLAMPDNMLLPFLDRNPLRYTSVYLRSMLSDLGILERFGDFDMKIALKKVQDEADIASRATQSEAERLQLYGERDKLITDIAAIRDRLKGVYGFSPDTVSRNIGKISQILGDYDVTTNMGGSGLSQFPDMAGAVFRYAFTGTKALGPAYRSLFAHLLRTSDTFAKARDEYRAIGIGTETFLNSRAHELADIGDVYQPAAKAARIMRAGAEATMVLSGSSMMTDWAKTITAIAAGNNILGAARAVVAGTATPKMIAALAENNIDAEMATRIWGAFESGGGRIDRGVHLPNTADWTDLEARKMFEAGVGRESDIGVVSPGEDRPLFLSKPTLALIGKYKSFVAAATTRILLANLQRRDASTLAGLFASVGLGMLVYATRSVFTGAPLSERPQDWIKEGVDRSGVLGWFGEANAMAAQMTRGSADVWRLVGADKPLTRFASRSVLGTITGPIGGKIESLQQITGAASTGEWTSSDVRKLRQLLPFQNLFYIRRLIDEVETNAKDTFGIGPANGSQASGQRTG